ncbi:hypothetical protein BS630_35900 [Rhizobium laguerreae]|nr:hypothetical protein BS630_35900 [Rhizobium laguerreae]
MCGGEVLLHQGVADTMGSVPHVDGKRLLEIVEQVDIDESNQARSLEAAGSPLSLGAKVIRGVVASGPARSVEPNQID